jgi:hypothetical protein
VRVECDDWVDDSGGRLELLGERLRALGYWQDKLEMSMPLRENGNRSIRGDLHCVEGDDRTEGTWTWRTRLILTYSTFADGPQSRGYTSPDTSRYTCG